MALITVVCAVLYALAAVKPWKAIPWIKRRIELARYESDDDFDLEAASDDPLSRFQQSRAAAALFKTDCLYD